MGEAPCPDLRFETAYFFAGVLAAFAGAFARASLRAVFRRFSRALCFCLRIILPRLCLDLDRAMARTLTREVGSVKSQRSLRAAKNLRGGRRAEPPHSHGGWNRQNGVAGAAGCRWCCWLSRRSSR